MNSFEIKFPSPCVEMPSGCVAVWRLARGPRKVEGPRLNGRAQLNFCGELWKAARLSYNLNVEEIPRLCGSRSEGFVCHTCDIDWCIRPSHLYLGTAKQNVADTFNRNPCIRENMAAAGKGNKNRLGIPATPESRKNLCAANAGNKYRLGKNHTEETKRKMSEAQKRRWAGEVK